MAVICRLTFVRSGSHGGVSRDIFTLERTGYNGSEKNHIGRLRHGGLVAKRKPSVLPAIENRVATHPLELKPLADVVRRHYARGASVRPDGTVQIAQAPWMGPEAFALILYPAADAAWVSAYGQRLGRPVPEAYARVLASVNGCFVFGLALYGLPPSLQDRPPRRDHSLEPLDLAAANRYCAREYRGAGEECHS